MIFTRLSQNLAGRAAAWFIRLLRLTVRRQHIPAGSQWTPYVRPEGNRRFLFSLWHDQIVLSVMWPIYSCGVLTSKSKDGGLIAGAMRSLGMRAVRGSSNKGGAAATRQLFDVAEELHITVTPDGPRGPRHVLKDGIVYLASRTGRPVIPCALAVSNAWQIKGRWTDMAVPKPFSKVVSLAGIPIHLPADMSRSQLSDYAEIVQNEMHRLQILAERILDGDKSAAALVGQPGRYPDDHIPADAQTASEDNDLAAAA